MVELAWTEVGAGEPVVLLHAFPLSSRMWEPVVGRLAGEWRVLTPDLRGCGASPLGDDPPSLDAMADDVVGVLARGGIDRAVVGGVSMGGYVLMAMLRRHPQLVRAALLVDTKMTADSEEARANRLRMADELERTGTTAPLLPMLDKLVGETTRRTAPETVALVRSWVEAADPAAAAWAQRAMAARPDSTATLAAVDVPLAVVRGEEDVLSTHDDALAMVSAVGPIGTAIHEIPWAGHLAVVEQPDRTAGAVADALRQLTAAAPPPS